MKRYLFLVLLIALGILPVYAENNIILNADDSEELTSDDVNKLTNIFTRKVTTWELSGNKITVFTKPLNSIEHKLFVMEWLGMSNYRYKKLLQQNTFSGSASSVKTVASDEQMYIIISSTPNSIGYINDYMVLNNDSEITIIYFD